MAPSKTAAKSLVREFVVAKDTPGTKQFKEVDVKEGERAAIGTIYVTKKALMEMGNTSKIRVTVEAIG